ncbi:hypothetical protein DXG01_010852 [Tephrocybe rancida]|nr:hypothetical protein DXG01_010852 [Tephrocybe rancida]
MFSKTFFALAILVSGALAQSGTESSTAAEPSTSLPAGINQCIIDCVTTAAQDAGCSSFTDLTCVCTSTPFQTAAAQCLQSTCTPADVQAALALQAQQCSAIPPSGSATGSATTEGGATSTPVSGTTTGTTSVSRPVSTSSRATSTAPTSSRAATSGATAPTTSTTNAAMGKKESMGLLGLVVAGVFGLVL